MASFVRKKVGVPKYDPFLRDFVTQANGLTVDIHPVDQTVALLLGIPVNSFIPDTSVGNKLKEIKRISPTVDQEVVKVIRETLAAPIARDDIELVDVVVEVSKAVATRMSVGVFYRNLRLETPTVQADIQQVTLTNG